MASALSLGWAVQFAFAVVMTVAVALAAFLLGLVFGMAGAWAKLQRGRLPRAIGDLYTTVVRGVPDLLIIYLFFFGSSQALMAVARLFGYDGYVGLDAFGVGAVAIGLVSGAYSSEVIRGAVLAIPRGELEAGRAVGM